MSVQQHVRKTQFPVGGVNNTSPCSSLPPDSNNSEERVREFGVWKSQSRKRLTSPRDCSRLPVLARSEAVGAWVPGPDFLCQHWQRRLECRKCGRPAQGPPSVTAGRWAAHVRQAGVSNPRRALRSAGDPSHISDNLGTPFPRELLTETHSWGGGMTGLSSWGPSASQESHDITSLFPSRPPHYHPPLPQWPGSGGVMTRQSRAWPQSGHVGEAQRLWGVMGHEPQALAVKTTREIEKKLLPSQNEKWDWEKLSEISANGKPNVGFHERNSAQWVVKWLSAGPTVTWMGPPAARVCVCVCVCEGMWGCVWGCVREAVRPEDYVCA